MKNGLTSAQKLELFDELLKVAKEVDENHPVSYCGEWDEVGECSFCHKISYHAHSDDCPIPLAKAVLAKVSQKEKENKS
jgi:hypothetical protein